VTTSTGTGSTVLSAAPTLSGNVSLSTGNLVIGTSGKGIDFSATPGTGTSELLADYEEGTWTPVPSSDGTPPTFTPHPDNSGTYVKVGNLVYARCVIRGTISAIGTGTPRVTGLPFASSNFAAPSFGLTNILTGVITSAYTGVSSTLVNINGPVWNTSAGAYLMMNLVYSV